MRMNDIGNYIKLLRLRQWIKNSFILIPAIFAYDKLDAKTAVNLAATLMAFCLFSSAVYAVNDIFDAEKDRLHPRKKFRPIAAGKISVRDACVFAVAIFCVALSFACFANRKVLFIGIIYVLLNAAYSWRLKHIALVDVFGIAGGFILRVYAGGAAMNVGISPWLMLNTLFLSLFLAFGKRYSELIASSREPEKHRSVLSVYTPEMLIFFLVSSCAMTLVCYSLYTIDPNTIRAMRSTNLIYTVPLAAYGLFRYVLILFQQGEDRDIAEVILSDWSLLSVALLWFAVVVATAVHGFIGSV